uniref:Amino acid transporter transmembrane domain-containing protein n=1 Tax=Rhizochromulina marina TaxID=1034831 RepID=A0A7S2WLB3_9STRA|mmetsp:Transcript_27508/g.80291  ORF Transcript_27508/g.80291 Transcript_27508/m.80291 type:complete len:573 (+) Transcript_27508:80-1798(+)
MKNAPNTYAIGSDDGELARRARELGLQRRARELELQSQRHHRRAGSLISSSELVVGLISVFDPEADGLTSEAAVARALSRDDLSDEALVAGDRLDEESSWGEVGGPGFVPSPPPTLGQASSGGSSRGSFAGDPPPRRRSSDHGESGGVVSNMFDVVLAIIKATIGPAVLYMPKGFQEGGLCFSTPMLVFSFLLFACGSRCLIDAWSIHRKSYPALMGEAYGQFGVNLVRFVIVSNQCGICLTYFIFVATNLQDLLQDAGVHLSLRTLCLLQLLVYIPLTWIHNLRHFAITNMLANMLILFSLLVLSSYAVIHVSTGDAEKIQLFNPSSFYLFVGTSAFIFEGVMALVVPLQEVVHQDLKPNFPKVFVRTLGGIVLMYIAFGILNYTAYGRDTETVLTVNLPPGPWKVSVQAAYSIAVIFTFPLQLFPAFQILKSTFARLRRSRVWQCRCLDFTERKASYEPLNPGGSGEGWRAPPSRKKSCFQVVRGNTFRGLLVVCLCFVAIAEVNMLDKIVSLLGAFLGIPLAFIFPFLIHFRLVEGSRWDKALDCGCATVGICLALTCSAITLATWNDE